MLNAAGGDFLVLLIIVLLGVVVVIVGIAGGASLLTFLCTENRFGDGNGIEKLVVIFGD